MSASLTAVVVNWNAGDQLRECVASIAAADLDVQIVVVDNASTDGSLELLEVDPRVKIIQTGENLGFGRGVNVGLRQAETPWVACLNPDVVVEPDALGLAVRYLEANDDVGLVGPRLDGMDGSPLATCGFRPRLSDAIGRKLLLHLVLPFFRFRRVRPVEPSKVDWVTGAFMVGRRDALTNQGGFDEAIFMYFEDLDLCLRLASAGWSVHYVPDVRGRHVGGHSSSQAFDRMLVASDRSYRFFTDRHLGHTSARLLSLLTPIELVIRSIGWIVAGILPSQRPGAKSRLRAYRTLMFENLSLSADRFRGSAL